MLKSIVKTVLRNVTKVVRAVPALLVLTKWTLSFFPRFEALTIRLVSSSLAAASRPEDKLSDAEIRVLVDLREAISAKQSRQV